MKKKRKSRPKMTEILIVLLAVSGALQWVVIAAVRSRLNKRTKDLLSINAATLKAVTAVINASGEQAKINSAQHELNQLIGHNLEVLGVHTKLLKPSVGFEAEQFLSWYNRKKGENGEV